MEDILVPIFICCVLPLGVVITVFISSMYSDKRRSDVLIKALETNNSDLNVDKLAEALGKRRKTPREVLNKRLLIGCICLFSGIAVMLVPYLISLQDPSVDNSEMYLVGAILLAIGISYLIVYFMTRKQILQEDKKDHKETEIIEISE